MYNILHARYIWLMIYLKLNFFIVVVVDFASEVVWIGYRYYQKKIERQHIKIRKILVCIELKIRKQRLMTTIETICSFSLIDSNIKRESCLLEHSCCLLIALVLMLWRIYCTWWMIILGEHIEYFCSAISPSWHIPNRDKTSMLGRWDTTCTINHVLPISFTQSYEPPLRASPTKNHDLRTLLMPEPRTPNSRPRISRPSWTSLVASWRKTSLLALRISSRRRR